MGLASGRGAPGACRIGRVHRTGGSSQPWTPFRDAARAVFDEKFDEHVDWMKYNADYWLRDHRGFLEFFFDRVFVEPHSTKPIEDSVRWGLDTTPEVLVATAR